MAEEKKPQAKYGADAGRRRTIINASRQILYASQGKDFAAAARRTARELRDSINNYLANSKS